MTRSLALATRELIVFRRAARRMVFSFGLPLLTYAVVVVAFDGVPELPSRYGSYALYAAPMPVVFAAALSSVNLAANTVRELRAGIFVRARALPMSSYDLVGGRAIAEGLKLVVVSLTVMGAAVAAGARPELSWRLVLPLLVVPLVLGTVTTFVTFAVGLRARSPESTQASLLPWTIALSLVSTGFVPVETFPTWAQPAVTLNPLSAACDTMRLGIAGGSPMAAAVLAAWSFGLITVATISLRRRW